MAKDYQEVRCATCHGSQLGIVQEIVEVVVIGITDEGAPVGDGGPEYAEVDEAKAPPIWCSDCNGTVAIEAGEPNDKEDDEDG